MRANRYRVAKRTVVERSETEPATRYLFLIYCYLECTQCRISRWTHQNAKNSPLSVYFSNSSTRRCSV